MQLKFIKATLKPPAPRARWAGLSPLECQLPLPHLTHKRLTSQRSKSTSFRLISRGLNVEKGCGMYELYCWFLRKKKNLEPSRKKIFFFLELLS